jgi:hypothetical protein
LDFSHSLVPIPVVGFCQSRRFQYRAAHVGVEQSGVEHPQYWPVQ